jgi:hypothetical protein
MVLHGTNDRNIADSLQLIVVLVKLDRTSR